MAMNFLCTFLSDYRVELIAIPFTLLLNALLVASEFSLIKIRFSHFNPELRKQVEGDKWIGSLIASGDRTIRSIRYSLTGCLFLYALLSFPVLHSILSGLEMAAYRVTTPVAAVLAFLVAVSLHYLVAELTPRAMGLTYPAQSLRLAMPFIVVFRWISRPIRKLMFGILSSIWRILRNEAVPDLDSLELETQIEFLDRDSPGITQVAQLILKNTMMMRDLVVEDVLLPRNQVKYFDLNAPLDENLAMAKETGHTRFPLCYGDLDTCLGLIHIKDIFRYKGDLSRLDLRRIKRNMIRINTEEPLESALTKLLSHRMHMALVIDEFRGAEGVLTLERILEQLVGDIRDEFDADEEVLIQPEMDTGETVVSGLTPLHEIESKFNVELETEEVSTIGGLVTSELGRIPEANTTVLLAGLQIEITEVDETRVVEVIIRRADQLSDHEGDRPQPTHS